MHTIKQLRRIIILTRFDLLNHDQQTMEILPLEHWFFQASMFCLLISYIQLNELYLRILTMFGSVFFFMLAVYVYPISLDPLIYNAIHILVNFYKICNILYQKRKIRFSPELEDLFKEVFEGTLTRHQFKFLAGRCIRKVKVLSADTEIVHAGNPFTDIIILGNTEAAVVELYFMAAKDKPQTLVVDRMPNWSWVGIIEYICVYMNEANTAEYPSQIEYSETLRIRELSQPVMVYFINKKNLLMLLKDKEIGSFIGRAVMSKMLEYLSSRILENQERMYFDQRSQHKEMQNVLNQASFSKQELQNFEEEEESALIDIALVSISSEED